MVRRAIRIGLVALMVLTAVTAYAAAYIGNSDSRCFHRPGCRSVRDIRADHHVRFSSRKEAIDQGYVPCRRCKP